MTASIRRTIAALAMLSACEGFKFMQNFKMPTVGDAVQEGLAKEKFGDKSECLVLGTFE